MQKLIGFFSNKFVLAALAILAACLLVWFYFFVREGEKKNSMDAIRAVPADAVFALRVNDLNKLHMKLCSEGELFTLLAQERAVVDIKKTLDFVLNTLASQNSVVGDFSMQPMWISAHVFGRDLAFLFAQNLPDNLYLNNVRQLLPLLTERGFSVSELPYDSEKISTFKKGDLEVFHAAVVRRVLVISSSRVLVEMAVRQAHVESSLADNEQFMSASKTAGAHVDFNLYVNHAQLPKLMPLVLSGRYARSVDLLSKLGNFTVLDASLKQEALQLSGFLFTDNMQASYFSAFRNQKNYKLTVFDILPRVTDGVMSVGISDAAQLLKDYTAFCDRQMGADATRKRQHAELKKLLGQEPAKFYEALFPVELSLAHVPITGLEAKDTWFTIVKSSKVDAAKKEITEAIAKVANGKKKKERDYVKTEVMSNNEPLSVFQNPAPGITASLFGSVFARCPDDFLTIVGDYLIFSSSRAALKEFALAALLKKTLAQTVNIANYAASEANVMVYLNPAKPDADYFNVLKPAIVTELKRSELLASSGGMCLQMRVVNSRAYCNVFYKMQDKPGGKQSSGAQAEFEVKLDAPLVFAPWVVKNHKTGQNEILAQDAKNNIYLIDNQGTLLWKRTLDDPIMGDVQQIDYLKNKKLQLVFSTKSKLYVVDRLGRDVEKYPVKFAAQATSPVAIFDYDKSRDYRFFVACADGKIYAYERNGKRLAGFSPALNFGTVTLPPMHVRSQDKDFIVIADNRRVHILNRRGEERVHVREAVAPAYNSTLACEYGLKGKVVRLVTTSSAGELVFIYFDGNVEHIALSPKPTENHFFTYSDHNAYVILDGKDLRVYESNLRQRYHKSFKYAAKDAPALYVSRALGAQCGVYCAEEGKAYLVDNNGDVLPNFPVKAAAPLLMANLKDGDKIYNVVVGDENGFMTCYNLIAK
ncbi:MAG: hypothetical protein LBK47_09315 [Prevotellaceae bacterium]|jgi:hypothetical protein|nr:hypothetical protein [Prevotellaceae bacterium]